MAEEKKTFEQKLERLRQIVSKVEGETLPLEEAMALYKEGQTLVKELQKELQEAEQKIAEAEKGPDGEHY